VTLLAAGRLFVNHRERVIAMSSALKQRHVFQTLLDCLDIAVLTSMTATRLAGLVLCLRFPRGRWRTSVDG
jgi:hypothetical protein